MSKQKEKIIQPRYFLHYGDIPFFYCYPVLPFLKGEDYPILTKIWDNEEDKIYD